MTKKKNLWCPICEKDKPSHNFYKGVMIHERDDVPKDTIYFINEEADYTNSFKNSLKKKKAPIVK